jgi:hypothetical protein
MKRIVLALAAVAAIATPVVMHVSSAGAAAGNSTINCNNFGGNNRCSATDPDGINYIRVIDPVSNTVIKSVDLSCADNVTRKGFNFEDANSTNNHYQIRIGDCTNNTDTYTVVIPQAVV